MSNLTINGKSLTQTLTAVLDAMGKDPRLASTVAGAAIGGGYGAMTGEGFGNSLERGAIGAGLGGLAGHTDIAAEGMNSLMNTKVDVETPKMASFEDRWLRGFAQGRKKGSLFRAVRSGTSRVPNQESQLTNGEDISSIPGAIQRPRSPLAKTMRSGTSRVPNQESQLTNGEDISDLGGMNYLAQESPPPPAPPMGAPYVPPPNRTLAPVAPGFKTQPPSPAVQPSPLSRNSNPIVDSTPAPPASQGAITEAALEESGAPDADLNTIPKAKAVQQAPNSRTQEPAGVQKALRAKEVQNPAEAGLTPQISGRTPEGVTHPGGTGINSLTGKPMGYLPPAIAAAQPTGQARVPQAQPYHRTDAQIMTAGMTPSKGAPAAPTAPGASPPTPSGLGAAHGLGSPKSANFVAPEPLEGVSVEGRPGPPAIVSGKQKSISPPVPPQGMNPPPVVPTKKVGSGDHLARWYKGFVEIPG